MQDEVNEKTVSLCIRGGKITAQLLKAAMRKALAQMEQEKAKQKQQSKVEKQQDDKEYGNQGGQSHNIAHVKKECDKQKVNSQKEIPAKPHQGKDESVLIGLL